MKPIAPKPIAPVLLTSSKISLVSPTSIATTHTPTTIAERIKAGTLDVNSNEFLHAFHENDEKGIRTILTHRDGKITGMTEDVAPGIYRVQNFDAEGEITRDILVDQNYDPPKRKNLLDIKA